MVAVKTRQVPKAFSEANAVFSAPIADMARENNARFSPTGPKANGPAVFAPRG